MYISLFPVIKCMQELNINVHVTAMKKVVQKHQAEKEGRAMRSKGSLI